MKIQLPLIISLCALFVLASCEKSDEIDETWKNNNEAQFSAIAAKTTEYTAIKSASGKGSIMYKVLKASETNGATPYFTDQVKVLYTGWFKRDWSNEKDKYEDEKGNLINNKIIFESTDYNNYLPSLFYVKNSVDGFATALQHMRVGDKWEVWIPWRMGYGSSKTDYIPAYTTLVFEIELVDIIK